MPLLGCRGVYGPPRATERPSLTQPHGWRLSWGLGAGLGLSLGLVFNVRLAQHAPYPVLASLVNFLVAFVLTSVLAMLGILGTAHFPVHAPLWAFGGGLVGATYVTLTLFTARTLGVAASTAGATLGQILGARLINAFGLLGQQVRPVSSAALIGVVLLFLAVAVLARERDRVS